ALRVLGFAYKRVNAEQAKKPDAESVESRLVFVGLAGMIDPPRQEAREAIAACHEAGIRVVMVTGDNPYTAQAIGEELGLRSEGKRRVVSGAELNELSDEELAQIVREVVVFARVAPEHKVRIVNALKANSEIVAMTGDGVNDAPALKRADIGVAMGITGTDVAKEASDMVITDDNFASIEHAVEEGRIVYDNIIKSVRYLLSCNIGELLTIFLAIIAGLKSPLAPIQILWMNLVTDSAPALALAMDPADPELMKRKPRDPKEKILSASNVKKMLAVGVLMTLVTLGVFLYYHGSANASQASKAGTMAFCVIVFFQLFYSIEISSEKRGFRALNKWIFAAVGVGFALQFAVVNAAPLEPVFRTTALAARDWLLATGLGFTAILIPELFRALRAVTKTAK
ncbi:MAG: HAD-IC family P-type ATPase, partial [Candidatus Norongarragalinales archaeon]